MHRTMHGRGFIGRWGAPAPPLASAEALAAIRSEVTRLNADATELERAMREADPQALECDTEGPPSRR
jgi:hypothetical protein